MNDPANRDARWANEKLEAALDEIGRAVIGKREVVELVLTALLAGGHVLIEDVPGVAKTLIAKSLAAVADLDFGRVQFTPDLIPSDITGSAMPDDEGRLRFQPGPVFANLVLGDEVNRAPPKTQAALLEAMEEQQVTIDGKSHQLPNPFTVVATQNPIETDGTYPLPNAQLDRFLLRTRVGYPTADNEQAVLRSRVDRGHEYHELTKILSLEEIITLQELTERVTVDDDVIAYVSSLARSTRAHAAIETGASTRAAIALVRSAQARALINGRDFVVPADVKTLAEPVLAHRLVTTTEAWVRGTSSTDVILQCLEQVPMPESLTESDRAAMDRDPQS